MVGIVGVIALLLAIGLLREAYEANMIRLVVFVVVAAPVSLCVAAFVNESLPSTKRRRAMKKERAARDEAAETREANRKYDREINCPICLGSGQALEYSERRHDEERSHEYVVSSDYLQKNHPEVRSFDDGYSWDTEIWHRWASKIECPFCNGKGVALAYFERRSLAQGCYKCHGSGKVEVRKKLEVGTEKTEERCGVCNGAGKLVRQDVPLVCVKTMSGCRHSNEVKEGRTEEKESGTAGFHDSFLFKQSDLGPMPFMYCDELKSGNQDRYAKSRPRSA